MSLTIQDLKDRNLIIFEAITGSTAYGTNLPTSDIDIKGVFIQPMDDVLGLNYVEQVSDEKNDTVYYELRRFLELLATNNPNLLELLNTPEDCVKIKHPLFDEILSHRDKFITKLCKNSFAGYASTQIKKARGLNKKIVNPVDKEKKSPLDFCYVIDGYKSMPLTKFLADKKMEQKFCGLVNVPNARDIYSLFYDDLAFSCFSTSIPENVRESNKIYLKEKIGSFGLGYKGIVLENGDDFPSNDIRLSSVPKEQNAIAIITYNKDGYTKYCKDYTEYWNWVDNRNDARYNDNAKHGKGYDGKNMAHCKRLLSMALEIGRGQGINVRRLEREHLLSIRRGEYDYDQLIQDSNDLLVQIDEAFDNSTLPEAVDMNFVHNLIVKLRRQYHRIMIDEQIEKSIQ